MQKKCKVKGCIRKYHAKEYCQHHYFRVMKYGSPFIYYFKREQGKGYPKGQKCMFKKCNTHVKVLGMCDNHYWQTRYKQKIFKLLGGRRCKKCGYTDIRALQIDHRKGGGTAELKKFGGQRMMVLHYLKHPKEAKKKLQILCANCNWVKKWENKEIRSDLR